MKNELMIGIVQTMKFGLPDGVCPIKKHLPLKLLLKNHKPSGEKWRTCFASYL